MHILHEGMTACHSDTEELIVCSISKQASIERRRMSKRLTDDALAYFDECVSLSTFDGSDFSSLEETPPIHQVSSTTQVEDGTTPRQVQVFQL